MYIGKIPSHTSSSHPSRQLKHLQADMFRAGYYPPGTRRSTVVDGFNGKQTQAALRQLQTDLSVAGVYHGAINGKVGLALDVAVEKLKREGMQPMPAGVSDRLNAFVGKAGNIAAQMAAQIGQNV